MQTSNSPITSIEEAQYLWGEKLLEALSTSKQSRDPLIENYLFTKSAHMKWAPEGVGKSIISMQEAIQGTVKDNMVFGYFHVPRAFNTLYLQMERPLDENLERLKIMKDHTAFDANRLVLDCSFQEFNFSNPAHLEKAIIRVGDIVKATFGKGNLDLVKLDPIYPMVAGGLKDDDKAAPIIQFSKLLQLNYGCSVDMTHHSNRGVKDESGERKGKDMFGSGSFAWHCTGIYSMTKTKEGLSMKLEKSSQSNLERHIDLKYDPQSHLSYVKNAQNKINKTDILMNYLRSCKSQDKTFTFEDMELISGVSTGYLRGLCSGQLKSQLEIVDKSPTGAHLYKFNG